MMESYIAVMGVQSYDKFWKTTPKEMLAVIEIKLGKSKQQSMRTLLADWGEGED